MLLNTLLFLVVLLVIGLTVLVLFALQLARGAIYRILKFFGGADNGRTDRHNRDYTGRRQQQYTYTGADGRQQSGGDGNRQRRSSQTADGTVIIDGRSERVAGQRIFADDEGEYVEFTEERPS